MSLALCCRKKVTIEKLNDVGMNNNHVEECEGFRSCFNLSSLGQIISHSTSLLRLNLSGNQIDDDQIVKWMQSMITTGNNDVPCLTYLNMSHNKITTYGMRLIINHFLQCKTTDMDELTKSKNGYKPDESLEENDVSVLSTLILSDNRIHAEGGRCIERVLRKNTSLVKLDLSMNRLEDSGGKMIIEGLLINTTLCELNLSSNCLGSKSATMMCTLLSSQEEEHVNNPLSWLDLSCNSFHQIDISRLVSSLEKRVSPTLMHFDIRSNAGVIGYDLKERIDSVICRNRSKNN